MRKALPPRRVPAMAQLARQLYLDGAPLKETARRTGLKPAARRVTLAPGTRSAAPARGHLLSRLWRAAERQLDEIEQRLAAAVPPEADAPAGPPRPAADAEKDARALAVLARTLRELSALEAEAQKSRKVKAEDDAVRDLDTFRRELARRLDRLRADGAGAEPAE